jgi:hypothetical protein
MRLSEKALENETCIGMFTTWQEDSDHGRGGVAPQWIGAQRYRRLERNLHPAKIGPRHRRALKARIDVWISKFAVGRHAWRAHARYDVRKLATV